MYDLPGLIDHIWLVPFAGLSGGFLAGLIGEGGDPYNNPSHFNWYTRSLCSRYHAHGSHNQCTQYPVSSTVA